MRLLTQAPRRARPARARAAREGDAAAGTSSTRSSATSSPSPMRARPSARSCWRSPATDAIDRASRGTIALRGHPPSRRRRRRSRRRRRDLRAPLRRPARGPRDRMDDQGVEAASLRSATSRVELLAALGADTPVGRFLARRGPGMHHVAYEVDDVPARARRGSRTGSQLIDAAPRQGLFGLAGRLRPSRRRATASCPSWSPWLSDGPDRGRASTADRSWARSVDARSAVDALERALGEGTDGVSRARRSRTAATRRVLRKVVYVKRFAREARVGFGA